MNIYRHHEHSHGGSTQDRNLVLLNYLHEHNEQHASELTELAEKLQAEGKAETAELILSAQKKFEEGNELLHEALHTFSE